MTVRSRGRPVCICLAAEAVATFEELWEEGATLSIINRKRLALMLDLSHAYCGAPGPDPHMNMHASKEQVWARSTVAHRLWPPPWLTGTVIFSSG